MARNPLPPNRRRWHPRLSSLALTLGLTLGATPSQAGLRAFFQRTGAFFGAVGAEIDLSARSVPYLWDSYWETAQDGSQIGNLVGTGQAIGRGAVRTAEVVQDEVELLPATLAATPAALGETFSSGAAASSLLGAVEVGTDRITVGLVQPDGDPLYRAVPWLDTEENQLARQRGGVVGQIWAEETASALLFGGSGPNRGTRGGLPLWHGPVNPGPIDDILDFRPRRPAGGTPALEGPPRIPDGYSGWFDDFQRPILAPDRQGRLSAGDYFVNPSQMAKHTSGGRGSQFLPGIPADELTLEGAHFADQFDLWRPNQPGGYPNRATFRLDGGPVGILDEAGDPTDWLTIHRRRTGALHATPDNPLPTLPGPEFPNRPEFPVSPPERVHFDPGDLEDIASAGLPPVLHGGAALTTGAPTAPEDGVGLQDSPAGGE